jgi:serine/threonine protein kinase
VQGEPAPLQTEYRVVRLLGRGKFSDTYEVQDLLSANRFACRVVNHKKARHP